MAHLARVKIATAYKINILRQCFNNWLTKTCKIFDFLYAIFKLLAPPLNGLVLSYTQLKLFWRSIDLEWFKFVSRRWTPSLRTVQRWCKSFKDGRQDIKDRARLCQPLLKHCLQKKLVFGFRFSFWVGNQKSNQMVGYFWLWVSA